MESAPIDECSCLPDLFGDHPPCYSVVSHVWAIGLTGQVSPDAPYSQDSCSMLVESVVSLITVCHRGCSRQRFDRANTEPLSQYSNNIQREKLCKNTLPHKFWRISTQTNSHTRHDTSHSCKNRASIQGDRKVFGVQGDRKVFADKTNSIPTIRNFWKLERVWEPWWEHSFVPWSVRSL
jgi:hypothetical protein